MFLEAQAMNKSEIKTRDTHPEFNLKPLSLKGLSRGADPFAIKAEKRPGFSLYPIPVFLDILFAFLWNASRARSSIG